MHKQGLTRRDFLKSTGLAGLGLMVSACAAPAAAPATEDSAQGETAAQPSAEGGNLRMLWVSQTALVEYFERYNAEDFGPANNGATVEIEIAPTEEFQQKMLSSIAAGAPPDIFRAVNYDLFPFFVLNGVVQPLDDLIERDNYQDYLATFLPGSLDAGNIEGSQYGIPFGGHPSSQYLFYNKTALGERGITLDNLDWTWDEYVSVAQEMTDPENQVFGAWIRANFEGYVVGLRSMGAEVLDETGTKSTIGSDEARRFWQLVYDLINVHKTTPQPTDMTDWKPPFAEGKVMMANDNGYRESFLREMVTDFEFDTFVLPNEGDKPRGAFVCDFAAISAASDNIDLAWEWQKGILKTEEGIERVQVARYIPLPTEEALLAPEVMSNPQYEFYVNQWIANPPLPIVVPANGRIPEVVTTLNTGFEAAWLQDEPLEEAITRIDAELQAILDKPQA